MDKELFELCKQVYEAVKWGSQGELEFYYNTDGHTRPVYVALRDNMDSSSYIGSYVPVYTSDYILEKLPPVIFVRTSDGHNSTAILTVWINGDKTAHVAYMIPFDEQNRGDYARSSDTPLKALLKVTLSLKEAGEI